MREILAEVPIPKWNLVMLISATRSCQNREGARRSGLGPFRHGETEAQTCKTCPESQEEPVPDQSRASSLRDAARLCPGEQIRRFAYSEEPRQ